MRIFIYSNNVIIMSVENSFTYKIRFVAKHYVMYKSRLSFFLI